jgi:alpha-tubulin suppressor-like RCC1 family protein
MNRHHLVPRSMRVLLVVSLLIAFVSIEPSAAPPLARAATPVNISAGYNHTCGPKTDGSLACWGENGHGQATPPIGSFSQVDAGGSHTCGVKTDGTVACWGNNSHGQATPPTGSFTQVSAGENLTCGVKTDGTVACWGANTYGQATPPSGSFTQVSAGWYHTCGLKADSTLACWGDNRTGEATPLGGSFTQVSAGWFYNCGVKSNGSLACWGDNSNGQATPPAGSFTRVSAGFQHTCGLRSDGTIACWGGQGTPVGTFTQVSAGGSHTCGAKSDGSLACWGNNFHGQAPSQVTMSPADLPSTVAGTMPPTLSGTGGVGGPYSFTLISGTLPPGLNLNSNGTWTWNNPTAGGDYSFDVKALDKGSVFGVVRRFTLRVTITTVTAITNDTPDSSTVGQSVLLHYTVTPSIPGTPTGNVTLVLVQQLRSLQVDADYKHTCGVKGDGTLACWGYNFYGQATPPSGSFSQVGTGDRHTCGLKIDGTLACWGYNGDMRATPPGGSFTQLSTSTGHNCGVKTDSTVVCWGGNWAAQATPPGGSFSQVSAGSSHTCGLKTDSTVACWGSNEFGKATPPADTFSQVSAGGTHTCGLKSDGTLVCWGWDSDGQISPPAGSFSQVSAGEKHTCGLKSDNTLVCWGDNSYGKATPPAGAFSQVSAGVQHTCGLQADSTVVCWGSNDDGQATPPLAPSTDSTETCTASVSAGGCAISFTSVGLKYLKASYAGDSIFIESVSELIPHSVKAATTTTITSVTPDPAGAERTVLVRYTVASAVQAQPSGMVTVRAGADSCSASVTAGECLLTFTSAGVKNVTATYAGDIAFSGSVSPAVAYTVTGGTTTTTITSITRDPAGAGPTVLVRYTVASAVQGIPGGMVTVQAGADSCTDSVAAGVCRLTFTSAGVKSLTATYAGDSAFFGSVSAAVTYTVTGGAGADKVVVFLPLLRR